MAQKGTKAHEKALEEGETPLPSATALSCLAAALRIAGQAHPMAMQICASDVEWAKSQWNDLPILELVHTPSASMSIADPPRAGGAVSSERTIEEFMLKNLKSGGKWKRAETKSLLDLGLDSLETVQLRNAFNKHFNANVPLSVMADSSQKPSW